MAVSITMARAQARANAETAAIDAGGNASQLILYDGTPPNTVNDALGSNGPNVAVVTIDLEDPSFQAASDQGTYALAQMTGTPSGDSVSSPHTLTFYRIQDGNASPNVIRQGLIGGTNSGADLELSTVEITSTGQTITVDQWQWREDTQ